MSTVQPAAPTAPVNLAPLYVLVGGLFVAMILFMALMVYEVRRPAPSPGPVVADPIPADLMAWATASAQNMVDVGTALKGKAPKPDAAALKAALGPGMKDASDRLLNDAAAAPDPGTALIEAGQAFKKRLGVK